ncbi:MULTISPECIES: type II toxin-antitoxin system VapC family toxin [Pasteurellaceae]|uniref:PIN domain-containing protein n=1 Tax=Pasteurella atlantica TaxID=2827233 RepID=A0AAW8CP29_9PAST|nr:PIN domain-containing protein [Pasteurella atlantica]MBR0573624.1 PIN domain-containing protein [Pasteurella atlantica]MDP8039379.1 PIN domain-containing protein [Pasteurella atlantica]MDP8041471.1 PIN domain-containing protein [Pasteurella atlantica]MDP8043604.1 PIN domain-containing protein [Pasteurella atlantica]MDP8045692.1 PIN domain-containing protein [Pasteurella atlantica]
MKGYLLDTNFLIYLSKNNDDPDKQEILKEMQNILEDPYSKLFTTPLISYEVLRGVEWQDEQKLSELKAILNSFEMLDVENEVSELAANLYRFDMYESQQKSVDRNFDKRRFDTFHFATAKVNHLEILSKDKDMKSLDDLYSRMQRN